MASDVTSGALPTTEAARRVPAELGQAKRVRQRLPLLVDAVDASVGTPEVTVGVAHLGNAVDLAEELAAGLGELGGRGLDVLDPEAKDDSFVEAVGGNRVGRVEVEDRAVRHREHRPAVGVDGSRQAEDVDEQLLLRGELVALEKDGVPGDPLDLHPATPSVV